MATARFAWGIDVGNRALKAVKLVPDGTGGYRIDDFEVIEHETVLSNAGDNRESLVQTALANFIQRHPQKGGVAGIGVSGQQSFARFIKLPPVEEKKIPEIVRFEAIQQIPFPLDDVEWSYQLFREAGSPDVEVGIFAIRKELISRHIGYFTAVDLNVQVVQMNPLAVYNAMYHDGQIDGTTMIIDVGAENADLIIADGERIWLRSVPIGGNNFTEALVKAFKLNFQKAEELKRNAATSKYARQIMQAMKPVFADLVGEIQRSIGFYASVNKDSRISKVIAIGGTFRLPSLTKYLSQNLQLEVHKLDRLAAAPPVDTKMMTAYSENMLSSVGAYGLALQALGEGKIVSSLLPETIRREKMWRDKTKWFGAAAALFVLGASIKMGATQLEMFKLNAAAETQQDIAAVQREAQGYDSAWSQIESDGGPDRQLILNIKTLEKYRTLWPTLLTDIHQALSSAAPQPELLSGDVNKIKSIPRAQRQQIFVEELSSVYNSDLTALLTAAPSDFAAMVGTATGNASAGRGGFAPPTPRGMGPMGPDGMSTESAAPTADKQRGFLVTLRLRTPNAAGYTFVDKTFLTALRGINLAAAFTSPPTPPRNYYIAKAGIISSTSVGNRAGAGNADAFMNRARGTGMQPGGFGGAPPGMDEGFGAFPPTGGYGGVPPRGPTSPFGGFDPGGGAGGGGQTGPVQRPQIPAQTAQATPVDPLADRLTGEDMRQDVDVTVAFVVVVDPPKPAAPVTDAEQTAAAQ
jgi:type IV pilus assembly protein PilM